MNDLSPTQDFYCDFVLNNKIEIKKVRETERVLAFYHTDPNWTLHIVIIPKEHIPKLIDVDDLGLIEEIFAVITDIIKEKQLSSSNYKVITNGGNFQSSQHLHFHLVSGEPKQSFNE